jgi:hypothetical protein
LIITRSLNPISQLDSLVSISLDPDSGAILAENDDEQPGLQIDSYINFLVTETGLYYIKVKAHNHPGGGGSDYRYSLKATREQPYSGGDATDPQVAFINPGPGHALNGGPVVLYAAASDTAGGSGMSQVEFWWHATDWASAGWQLLATDWNGADGWQAVFDPSGFAVGGGYALMARAFDRAGNGAVAVNWNVIIDQTPPAASLQSLPAGMSDTAISLNWTGSDALSGLDHFEIQTNRDGTGWQDWNMALPETAHQAWYIGQFGHQYTFRLRAIDRAGNPSVYAQTTTVLAASCQGDAYEAGPGDDTRSAARALTLRQFENHNFCGAGDEDWVRFNAIAGQQFLIRVLPDPSSAAQAALELYLGGETTPKMVNSSPGLGLAATLWLEIPATGEYFLRVRSENPALAGTGVSYQLWVGPGKTVYLPLIGR